MNDKDHRRATKGARFISVDTVTGRIVKLTANDLGVIAIETDEQRRVADKLRLPITRTPKLDGDEVADLKKKGA